MNTEAIGEAIEQVLSRLALETPRQLDVRLGVNRGQMLGDTPRKALASWLTSQLGDRPDLVLAVPLDITVLNADDKKTRGSGDIMVHIGGMSSKTQVKLRFDVPPSVGCFLGIQRFVLKPSLLPSLSEGQRRLLAAYGVLMPRDKSPLNKLLKKFLNKQLREALTADTPAAKAFRDKLRRAGLFADELLADLNSL